MTSFAIALIILIILSLVAQTLMASVYMSTAKRYIKNLTLRKIAFLVGIFTPGSAMLLFVFLIARTMFESVKEEFDKAKNG